VKKHAAENLRHLSMQELFRVEAENQTQLLTSGLLELERVPAAPEQLESLMRAAHSFKGAARIVHLSPAVQVAHALEDCFVAAQQNRLALEQTHIDVLLRGVDWLTEISKLNEHSVVPWQQEHRHKLDAWLEKIHAFTPPRQANEVAPVTLTTAAPSGDTALFKSADIKPPGEIRPEEPDRFLRLTAENLNRLLALAGESLVESRWLRPFSESMQRLKRMQMDLEETLDGLRQQFNGEHLSEPTRARFNQVFGQATEARHFLNERLQELDLYDRR
jgi:two-component system sensor histidine kinase and response regulator WspE